MIEINGICYADDFAPAVKVTHVAPLPDYVLRLVFSTGEEKFFDVAPLLDRPAFQPLRDPAVFNSVSLDGETVTWLDGAVDIAPETLYSN